MRVAIWSHPTGVRGLKLFEYVILSISDMVAPHWGAWIEIDFGRKHHDQEQVAPHWGAWIEMFCIGLLSRAWIRSHPTGVRGLKSESGSWRSGCVRSHPTGVRGLKSIKYDGGAHVPCRTPLGCVD